MQSSQSSDFIIEIEEDDSFTFMNWIYMKQSMALLLPTNSLFVRKLIGSMIHAFMISSTIFSGVLFGYILFLQIPPNDNAENDLLSFKILYILTSTIIGSIFVIFEESFSYLIESRVEARISYIEEYIRYVKEKVDDQIEIETPIRVLELIEDVKILSSKLDTNFQNLFDNMKINTAEDKSFEETTLRRRKGFIV